MNNGIQGERIEIRILLDLTLHKTNKNIHKYTGIYKEATIQTSDKHQKFLY